MTHMNCEEALKFPPLAKENDVFVAIIFSFPSIAFFLVDGFIGVYYYFL
jgi:hypothetical protein